MGLADIVGAATNPFGVTGSGEWDLIEGAFRIPSKGLSVPLFFETRKKDTPGITTALESLSDSGGRRKVQYEYPYKDGQRLDDLGRKGDRYTFNLKFFGPKYQDRLQEFINVVVRSKESGILTHPVLGDIPCGFTEFEYIHKYDEFSAVTIRATFLEDNTAELEFENVSDTNANAALRNALTTLADTQAKIGDAIFVAGAALLLPKAVMNGFKLRFDSVVGGLSRLLGQLASTFSGSEQLKALAARASQSGGVLAVSDGIAPATPSSSNSKSAALPPTFQVGFTEAQLSQVDQLQSSFDGVSAITPQNAVYQMNQVRKKISDEIAAIEAAFGVTGFDMVLAYRQLAVDFQKAVEASAFSGTSKTKVYRVPFAMSLRSAAFANGLDPDRQNDIAELNPELDSLNLVPPGTLLVVPSV